MQVAKETYEAMAKVVLEKMLSERFSKATQKYQDVSADKAASLVTLDDVKQVSAYNDTLEALASIALTQLPELKQDMGGLFNDIKKQRIEWAKPKTAKPKADF